MAGPESNLPGPEGLASIDDEVFEGVAVALKTSVLTAPSELITILTNAKYLGWSGSFAVESCSLVELVQIDLVIASGQVDVDIYCTVARALQI